MKNGIGVISWINIKSALVSGLITAVLAMAGYLIGIGDIFKIDVHAIVNVGALSALTALVSAIKSFFTTSEGNIIGVTKIVEETK